MDAMSSGLEKNGHDVRIIAMCTEKHPAPQDSSDRYKHVEISTAINPFSAMHHLALNKSYNLGQAIPGVGQFVNNPKQVER